MNKHKVNKRYISIKFYSLLVVLFFNISCNHEVELTVSGTEDHYVKMYYEDEFDHSNPIYYSIHKKDGSTIKSKCIFYGTLDGGISKEDFTAGVCDSIIYITFYDDEEVFVMVDLRNNKDYLDYENRSYISKDSLSNILKKCNPKLKIHR